MDEEARGDEPFFLDEPRRRAAEAKDLELDQLIAEWAEWNAEYHRRMAELWRR